MKQDVIIVGTGIAGLTAALYASRQELNTLVVGKALGGQAVLAPEIQNYPGVPETSGFGLIQQVESQARAFGAEIDYDEVVSVEEVDDGFKVATASGKELRASSLILAFGKTPRDLGVPGEAELKGKGVCYCAVCDGPLFRGRTVALVGAGSHAAEAASLLSDVAEKLYWISRAETPGVSPELLESLMSKGNLKLLAKTRVLEVRGEGKVSSVLVESEAGQVEIPVDGLFVEMGYVAKTDFVRGFVELNERGEIVVAKACTTSRPGVFAAGDVTDFPYKQAIVSAGMGATAALSCYRYLMGLRGEQGIRGDWKHVSVKGEKEREKGLFFAPPGS